MTRALLGKELREHKWIIVAVVLLGRAGGAEGDRRSFIAARKACRCTVRSPIRAVSLLRC